MPGIRSIVLATGNPHKVTELRVLFASSGIEVLGLNDLPAPTSGTWVEPVENARTCADNARIKATDYARQTGRTCLADDSGIEVDALALADSSPRPGVISSHYSTDGRETGLTRAERDAANIARVLKELDGVPFDLRAARFVCCMCLAEPSGRIIHESRGAVEGRIGIPPRVPSGNNGFGYDPLFLLSPEFTQTCGELSADQKNRISHRARAAAEMLSALTSGSIR